MMLHERLLGKIEDFSTIPIYFFHPLNAKSTFHNSEKKG